MASNDRNTRFTRKSTDGKTVVEWSETTPELPIRNLPAVAEIIHEESPNYDRLNSHLMDMILQNKEEAQKLLIRSGQIAENIRKLVDHHNQIARTAKGLSQFAEELPKQKLEVNIQPLRNELTAFENRFRTQSDKVRLDMENIRQTCEGTLIAIDKRIAKIVSPYRYLGVLIVMAAIFGFFIYRAMTDAAKWQSTAEYWNYKYHQTLIPEEE